MLTDCESGRARRESAAEGSLFNLEGALRFKEAREDGGLAQLGERLPCKQEVAGSIPTISTIPQKHTLLRGAKKQYNSQSFKIRAEPSEAGLRGRGDAAK